MAENNVLFTIFGATGDLAYRKLYPSLFRLYRKGDLQEHFAVIGTARREWSDEHFRSVVADSISDLEADSQEVAKFTSHFYYQAHDVQDPEHYVTLKKLSDSLDEKYQLKGNRLFYLAMSPSFFGVIVKELKAQKMTDTSGFHRVVIEKPFGSDLASATTLNDEITATFTESEVYRIDHYLGKEMIQNISAIRFGNNLFESMWNNRYIANVQINLAESLGVEDRGGYYDKSGALKDMVQNHILQILSLLLMEPPAAFSDEEIRAEKIKALNAVRIYTPEEVNRYFVRGQYAAGKLEDNEFLGYREEANVAADSTTETFVAGRFTVDNFRWSGVPIYIRTGKRLTEKGTRINIVFKQVPINLFKTDVHKDCEERQLPENVLTIYIQPTEGFSLTLNGKEIGPDFKTTPVKLDYRHSAETVENSPEAYERLILDALNGDSTNFTHWDEVAQSWRIVDAIRKTWDEQKPDFPNYKAGTMGPEAAFELVKKDGFEWIWQPEEWYRERDLL
ncbi:glucose-6-phosphate dehydrogenase [Enterococcus sp. 2201sp1_2201st1_B8_2201SCRN_220225]|uniref:glucose-6-phosphate dehydrogenase n=1 Tax=unclassified Enterococcus TaxID=2608891 RepID=UPI0034A3B055